MKTIISNVRVILEERINNVDIYIDEGRIISILPYNKNVEEKINYQVIDGKSKLLIPGMIDVHIHGANNYDMMDGTTKSIQEVSKKCAETGCTSFLATSVSSTLEDLLSMISSVKKVVGNEEGAKIVGIHLEGPYLNVEKKGMQNPKYLRHPNLDEMDLIFKEAGDLIKMVTIAPELPGGIELIHYLRNRNVVVAIAHSTATYEEAKKAFKEGASHITHCFNAMPAIHHREPGLVTAALEDDNVSVQAIVDGIHLHPGIIRLMHKIKGADGMVLTTDALQAMGVGDGDYLFGGHHVVVKDGVARLKDGTLASSTITMNKSLRLSVEFGIPLCDSIKMSSKTPASILSLNNTGEIKLNYDADLVLLDDNYNVIQTFIKGKQYFK